MEVGGVCRQVAPAPRYFVVPLLAPRGRAFDMLTFVARWHLSLLFFSSTFDSGLNGNSILKI